MRSNAIYHARLGAQISLLGTGLHWPKLDVDLTVDCLLEGVFGSRHWMRELAANATKSGETKSPAKSAARINVPATSQTGVHIKWNITQQTYPHLSQAVMLISAAEAGEADATY